LAQRSACRLQLALRLAAAHPRHNRVGCTPRWARLAAPTCWLPPPRGACAARRARQCATATPRARERPASLAHTAGRTPPPSGAKPAAIRPAQLYARHSAAAAAALRDGGGAVCGHFSLLTSTGARRLQPRMHTCTDAAAAFMGSAVRTRARSPVRRRPGTRAAARCGRTRRAARAPLRRTGARRRATAAIRAARSRCATCRAACSLRRAASVRRQQAQRDARHRTRTERGGDAE
jgi:hypothetical protein